MYLYKDIKQLCTLKIWTAYLLTNLSPQKITYKSYQMKNVFTRVYCWKLFHIDNVW